MLLELDVLKLLELKLLEVEALDVEMLLALLTLLGLELDELTLLALEVEELTLEVEIDEALEVEELTLEVEIDEALEVEELTLEVEMLLALLGLLGLEVEELMLLTLEGELLLLDVEMLDNELALELLSSSIDRIFNLSSDRGPGNCSDPVWKLRMSGVLTSPDVRVSINVACQITLSGNGRVQIVTAPFNRRSIVGAIVAVSSPARCIRRITKRRSDSPLAVPRKNVMFLMFCTPTKKAAIHQGPVDVLDPQCTAAR